MDDPLVLPEFEFVEADRNTPVLYRHLLGMYTGEKFHKQIKILNAWFDKYPAAACGWEPESSRKHLKHRILSNEVSQYYGGLWELYLHETFRRCGSLLGVEVNIGSTNNCVDFLIEGKEGQIAVEAVSTGSKSFDQSSENRINPILLEISKISDPNWDFWVEIKCEEDVPSSKKIIGKIVEHLGSRDISDKAERKVVFEVGLARITLRSRPRTEVLPSGTSSYMGGLPHSSIGDGSYRLREKLSKKRKATSECGLPVLIGLHSWDFMATDKSICSALYGQRIVRSSTKNLESSAIEFSGEDGFFYKEQKSHNENVVGVLAAHSLTPLKLLERVPTLYRNAPSQVEFDTPPLWQVCGCDLDGIWKSEEPSITPTDFFR